MDEIIIRDIQWTDSAKISFGKIIAYLQEHWSDKEIQQFISRTKDALSSLQYNPEMCPPSLKRKNVRIALLNKHTQMVYHYMPRKKQIEVLLFWGMKQHPGKFKY